MHAKSFSRVRFFVTLWTVACQAPLSRGFSRQEYWSGLPFPSPGELPNPGSEPASSMSPALACGFFTTKELSGKPGVPPGDHKQSSPLPDSLRVCPQGPGLRCTPLTWLSRDAGTCRRRAGAGLTHDHVVADVTESGLLEDVLLKGVGLASAAGVQAGPGGCGGQASGGRERAGAGADLGQHVRLQLHVAVGSLEEVVSTFAP